MEKDHVGVALRIEQCVVCPVQDRTIVLFAISEPDARATLHYDKFRKLRHERLLVVRRDRLDYKIQLNVSGHKDDPVYATLKRGETVTIVCHDVTLKVTTELSDDRSVVNRQTPWGFDGWTLNTLPSGGILHLEGTIAGSKYLLCIPGRNDAITNKAFVDVAQRNFRSVAVLYYPGLGPACSNYPLFNSHWEHGTDPEVFATSIQEAILHLQQTSPGQVDIYAHSTGCLLFADYLQRHGDNAIRSMLLSSPFFEWGWDLPIDLARNVVGRIAVHVVTFGNRQNGIRVLSSGDPLKIDPSRTAMSFQYPVKNDNFRPRTVVAVTHNFVIGCTSIMRMLMKRTSALTTKRCLCLVTEDDQTLRAGDIADRARRYFGGCSVKQIEYARHDILNSVFKRTSDDALMHVNDFWSVE